MPAAFTNSGLTSFARPSDLAHSRIVFISGRIVIAERTAKIWSNFSSAASRRFRYIVLLDLSAVDRLTLALRTMSKMAA